MIRAAALLLPVTAAIMAGCGEKPDPARALVVGGWAPAGTSCDGDAGVVYLKDGTWAGYNQSGAWTLSDGRLTLEVTERGGTDQPGRQVQGGKPIVATILSISRTELVERGEDGKTLRFERCKG